MELTGTGFPLIKGNVFQCFSKSGHSRLERFLRFPGGDGHNRACCYILENVVEKIAGQFFDDQAPAAHGVYQQCL